MNNYRMMLETATVGLSWQYDFTMASDAMALEYAMRHTKAFANVPWFMAMLLFRLGDTEAHIGRFVLTRPQARMEAIT